MTERDATRDDSILPTMHIQDVREDVTLVTEHDGATLHCAFIRRDGRLTSAAELLAEEDGEEA